MTSKVCFPSRSPSFFVVGASKCGTTSLYAYLKKHPEIFLPDKKELNHFSAEKLKTFCGGPDGDLIKSNLISTRDEYLEYFQAAKETQICGDISPSYFFHKVGSEIREFCPSAKIIILLRNPVDKVASQYNHLAREGLETLCLSDALLEEQYRAVRNWGDMFLYRESASFSGMVEHYFDIFGEKNVHVIFLEELRTMGYSVMQNLLNFLGVSNSLLVDTGKAFNRTGEVKIRAIQTMLASPSIGKQIAKKLLSPDLRFKLRQWITELNTGPKTPLDQSLTTQLHQDLSEDVHRLQILLGPRRIPWSYRFR